MNLARLRERGWTENEITDLLSRLERVQTRPHATEHLSFWLCILVLAIGTVAVVLELLPLFVLGTTALAAPIIFLLAACFGLLLVHLLRDVRIARHHQHTGAFVLLAASLIIVAILLRTLEQRVGAEMSSILLAVLFAAGIMVPYLAHWRATRGTA